MTGHPHPPKRETFNLVDRTNTDNKGVVRAVDVYTLRPWGLYMARPTPGRAQFHYLESWLLPSLGLRANVFHFNPGHEREQDFYLDVGEVTAGPEVWRTEDHYLDLVVHTGDRTELLDVDELLEHEATVPIHFAVEPGDSSGMYVHFLPGHQVQVWVSRPYPNSSIYPGPAFPRGPAPSYSPLPGEKPSPQPIKAN